MKFQKIDIATIDLLENEYCSGCKYLFDSRECLRYNSLFNQFTPEGNPVRLEICQKDFISIGGDK